MPLIKPLNRKDWPRPRVVIITMGLSFLFLAIWFWLFQPTTQISLPDCNTLTLYLSPFIRGEEHGPRPGSALTLELRDILLHTEEADIKNLLNGADAFFKGGYGQAAKFFEAISSRPDRLFAFQAAAQLRLGNYALSRDLYLRALTEPTPPLISASDRLGLAMDLFLLNDPAAALGPARESWEIRKDLLGPHQKETISALNTLSSSLMALSRDEEAGNLLKEVIVGALSEGISREEPVIIDSLDLLAYAYGRQGRLEELAELTIPDQFEARLGPPQPPDPKQLQKILADLDRLSPNSLAAVEVRRALIMEKTGNGPLCSGVPAEEALETLFEDENSEPEEAKSLTLCLKLADSLASRGDIEALEIVDNLPEAVWATGEFLEKKASILTTLGRLSEAEQLWRQSLAELEESELNPEKVSLILKRTMVLTDNILAQRRPGVEAEIELVGIQTRLTKKLPRRTLETYPETIQLRLYLARLLTRLNRSKDRQTALDQAEKAVRASLKAHPELKSELEELDQEIKDEAAKKPLPEVEPDPVPDQEVSPPPPDILRLELAALKLLNHPEDLAPEIEKALNWALVKEGERGPLYQRYFSLMLKFLEESGQYQALLDTLDQLIYENNGSDTPQIQLKSSALAYKARILMIADDRAGAGAALKEAEDVLKSLPGTEERQASLARQRQELLEPDKKEPGE